jgi:hypothetical protein
LTGKKGTKDFLDNAGGEGAGGREPCHHVGWYLATNIPLEIREPGKVMSELVEAVLRTQVLTQNDITSATLHDQKGWAIHCTTQEAAQKAAGLAITIQGYAVKVTPYRISRG